MTASKGVSRLAALRPTGTLGWRLALPVLTLVWIPLLLMGGATYVRTRPLLQAQAEAQLLSVSEAQVRAVQQWVSERELPLQIAAQRASLVEEIGALAGLPATSPEVPSRTEALRGQLGELQSRAGETLFSDLVILNTSGGNVLVSTRPEWEGAAPVGLSAFLSTPDVRTHPLLNEPLLGPNTLVLATMVPVLAEGEAAPSHLLVGINSGAELAVLMQELRALLEDSPLSELRSRVTYFMVEPDTLVRLSDDGTTPEAVRQATNSIFRLTEPGVSQLLGFWDPTPLRRQAAIEWVQGWPLAAVVDVSEDEVFADLIGLGLFTAVLVTAAAVVTILVVVTSANQFLQPVNDMARFAQRFSVGDWSQRVPVERDDELGAVAGALNRMAEELSGLYRQLESRVEERTRQIRTAAEVARAVIMTPDLDDLIRRSVELIRERFAYDYVAIFLIDRSGTNAVLSDATGELGAKLKGQRYRLAVGSPSIIGWVSSTNRPRMIPEIRREAAQPREDLLPQTRSEAAVPLQVAGRVVGVLDVQSSTANAFTPQDLEVLQTLADQLSAALQHARLIQSSVAAAERARVISQLTSQISGYLDVDKVLQTAALAIHRSLGNPEVAVKLVSPEELAGAPSEYPEATPETPEDRGRSA